MSTQGILISSNSNDKLFRSISVTSVIHAVLPQVLQNKENCNSNDSGNRLSKNASGNSGNSPRKILKPPVINPRLITSQRKSSSNPPPEPVLMSNIPSSLLDSNPSVFKTSQPRNTCIKRSATQPRSPPPISKNGINISRREIGYTGTGPIFPDPPGKPEKFSGNDKLAYKIWMKERAKYEKWESSKILYERKLADGNYSACQRIIDRLHLELVELSNGIKEDEYRRIFPEEPVKPSEYCPSNVKEAKIWYQQKIMYEAWENAFKLYQENSAKGDTIACQKLIDIIQMTIHNPHFKTNPMSSSQPSSTRRSVDPLSKPLMEETQVSRPQVKFAPNPCIVTNPTGGSVTVPKPTRPKLKPPASWTKQKTKEANEDKNTKMTSLSSSSKLPHSGHMSLPVSEISRGAVSYSTLNLITENVQENDKGSDGVELLRDIDLGLADLNISLDNYFNRDNV